jgi:hypothetical protein
MEIDRIVTSRSLLKSLVHGPLLVTDLPEAQTLGTNGLALPVAPSTLNLQQKLGHLYEDALSVLLRASPTFDVLEENLQIQEDAHTTVGELDFLLRKREGGQLIHLELATKFYLAAETGNGIILPGPDARDNYYRKLRRLREHQLVLTRTHQHCLPERYREEAIIVKQLIYGCFFDHVNASKQASPDFANRHCRRGRWLHAHECVDYFSPGTRLEIIPKPLWPVPLKLLQGIKLERWSHEQPVDRCLMVRVANERTPYFIAPSGYPGTGT